MKHLVLSVLGVLILSSCAKTDNTDLYQELKSVDKLVLASMAITKTAKKESSDRWYKIGKRIAVYSYDSYMRAYVDLSALQMEDLVFDEDAKTVKVTLPPVITEITGRDMEMRKEYENIGMMRSDLDSKERAEIKEEANASFKTEIEENPMFKQQLTDAAKRKARKYFETIFEANGYTASIDFKPSNSDRHDEE
ncbi:MAG: DUF4230 domain-containing protein [Muribaculaceae bacterium]|nr:DUF4230 domain-containing protein [Muribaculaceae bacterium]